MLVLSIQHPLWYTSSSLIFSFTQSHLLTRNENPCWFNYESTRVHVFLAEDPFCLSLSYSHQFIHRIYDIMKAEQGNRGGNYTLRSQNILMPLQCTRRQPPIVYFSPSEVERTPEARLEDARHSHARTLKDRNPSMQNVFPFILRSGNWMVSAHP